MRHCIACGHRLPERELFKLNHAPASAQDIPDAEEVKADRGIDLDLYQCPACGLVQFDCEPVSYYRDVIRAGGFSTTMTGLRRNQYYHLEGKRFLEVGCGRGEFLKVLTEFPVKAYGMEHKADLVEIAKQDGLCVWQEFPETKDQVVAGYEEAPYDGFLSFNFLEHQPRPEVMLQAIRHNLAEDGMGLVTVPSLEYILEKGSYYELIRDHIAYYSFGTLRALLEHNGFEVLEEEMINRDTLSMVVKKMSDERWNKMQSQERAGEKQKEIKAVSVQPLLDGYQQVSGDLRALKGRLEVEKKRFAVWGASHQGFTLLSTLHMEEYTSYIIDSAPFKQGRFAPSSHIPIVAPEHFQEEPVDVILIVAPGYSDEIAGIIRERFGAQVEALTLKTDRIEPD